MAQIVKITPKSNGALVRELQARAASLKGAQIAARIQVPSDLSWWYFLEFGTATRQDGQAPVRGGGVAYPIRPIDRGDASTLKSLAWPDGGGGTVFRPFVLHHPGIRPHPFVRGALGIILKQFGQDIKVAAAQGGLRKQVLKDVLMTQTMVFAKALLVENLAIAAPGTRDDGNLLGETASSVFEEEAEIVDAWAFSGANRFSKAEAEAKRFKPEYTPVDHTPKPAIRTAPATRFFKRVTSLFNPN